MLYYIYVSSTKVEMLFDQMHSAQKRTVLSKIALGPSIGRFESSSQIELTSGLYAKLQAVEKALESNPGIANLGVADMESLPAYCRDTGLWNASLISKTYQASNELESAASYCLLRDCGEVLAFLVGSSDNLSGRPEPPTIAVSPSFAVDEYLLRAGEHYWTEGPEAPSNSDGAADKVLASGLAFCGTALSHTPPRMLSVLFRVFSVFQIIDRDIALAYERYPSCMFTGTPRLLVTGSPLSVALPT